MGARFYVPVHILPEAQPGSSSGVPVHSRKQINQDVVLTTHLYLASSLKKEYSYNSTPALNLFSKLYGDIWR